MKRKIIIFLSFAIINPLVLIAQKHELSNGLYWELNNRVLTISGQGSVPEDVLRKIGYEKVREIDKVIIKEGVSSIERCAFMAESEIKSVEIQSTMTQIHEKAFAYCGNLNSVSFPNSLIHIDRMAFCLCKSLHSIEIPSSVRSIGESAFSGCDNLRVILHSTQISLGASAFDGCIVYKTVMPPNNSKYYIVSNAGQYGLMNDRDNWIIPLGTYSAIEYLSDNYIKVLKKGYGIVTLDGNEIVPPELDAIQQCGKGFFRYKLNGFWGVMNYAGKIIIDTDRGYTSIGNFVTFTKRFPYTMTGYKGECDINGRQISKIKVETPQQAVASSSSSPSSSSSSSTSSNNSGSGTTQTVVVEHHRDPVPVQEWQACFGCGGMGTMGCDNCGGSGTKYIGDRLHRCSRCNGQGIIPCNICYGSKGKYVTVYR